MEIEEQMNYCIEELQMRGVMLKCTVKGLSTFFSSQIQSWLVPHYVRLVYLFFYKLLLFFVALTDQTCFKEKLRT